MNHIHQNQPVLQGGANLQDCRGIMIMLHGRNADAEDILGLSRSFGNNYIHYVAPQANNFSWYPYGFMEDTRKNEPGLSSGLQLIKDLVIKYVENGFKTTQIYLLGFSQGACLTLEFAAQNPAQYGGVFALSGGLIGSQIHQKNYSGDFLGCPVFLGCGDKDLHIPVNRVEASAQIFKHMNAKVTTRIFKGMPHTVVQEEIDIINDILSEK